MERGSLEREVFYGKGEGPVFMAKEEEEKGKGKILSQREMWLGVRNRSFYRKEKRR